MDNNKRMCRPDSPQDGPMDAVILKADCIRTDYIENPENGEVIYQQRDKGEASITASVEIGVFTIRDRVSNVSLSVALQDAMEVIAATLEAAKEVGSCPEKILESADIVEGVSDS